MINEGVPMVYSVTYVEENESATDQLSGFGERRTQLWHEDTSHLNLSRCQNGMLSKWPVKFNTFYFLPSQELNVVIFCQMTALSRFQGHVAV